MSREDAAFLRESRMLDASTNEIYQIDGKLSLKVLTERTNFSIAPVARNFEFRTERVGNFVERPFGEISLFPSMYCTVLYCTVLYCTVLYCTVLYCTVLYCTELY